MTHLRCRALPRTRARDALALYRFEAHRVPHLKFLTEADKGDALGDAGMRDQIVGKADASLVVEIQRLRRAKNGLRFVVIVLAEQRIVFVEALLELRKQRVSKGFERGTDERGDAVERRPFPAAARICRYGAGILTRPLASSLFTNVETKGGTKRPYDPRCPTRCSDPNAWDFMG